MASEAREENVPSAMPRIQVERSVGLRREHGDGRTHTLPDGNACSIVPASWMGKIRDEVRQRIWFYDHCSGHTTMASQHTRKRPNKFVAIRSQSLGAIAHFPVTCSIGEIGTAKLAQRCLRGTVPIR